MWAITHREKGRIRIQWWFIGDSFARVAFKEKERFSTKMDNLLKEISTNRKISTGIYEHWTKNSELGNPSKFKMSSRRVQAFSDDLKNVEFETSEEVEVTPTFDSMGLREELIRGIYAYG